MTKYIDLKVAAYALQTIGLIAFLGSLFVAFNSQDIWFVAYGVVALIWWYAIGGALLVLIDIAKSVRVSAVAAVEQDERRKAKAKAKSSNNGRSRVRNINSEKRRSA